MNKIKYLEGLRGVAALIVVFSHLRNTSLSVQQDYLNACIYNLEIYRIVKIFTVNTIEIFLDGNLAVWIFWVLSSYVMSIRLFKRKESDKIIIGYFSKRYIRLFVPVLASIIFAYVLLECGCMFNSELAALQNPSNSTDWLKDFYNFEPDLFNALKSACYDTFFSYEKGTSYNVVLWTIQNEFLGSLFIFGIFGIIRHNKRRYLLYFIITIIVLKLHLYWLCAFIVGYVMCDYDFSDVEDKILNNIKKMELKLHKHKTLIFIASLLFILFGRALMGIIEIPQELHNLILSIFMVYICCKNSYFQFLFSQKIPFWLGRISFSLYLIHLPIICSLTSFLIIQNYSLTGKIMASLITLAVILILSPLFTKYVDKKGVLCANKIGDYFKRYS
jgi:peptidoglycan/LPS O-acetylase OafA/YrhL